MPQVTAAEYCVRMIEEVKTGAFWRDCVAEFFATFLFIASTLFLVPGMTTTSPLRMAIGVTFAWTGIGYGLCDFGGAQMNNAVTFAALIRREICFLRALIYWITQGAAAVAASFFVYAVTPEPLRGNMGNTDLPTGVLWWQAVAVEAFATAMVCFAYLGSYSIERKGYVILSSLPVGISVGLGMFLTLPYSGGSLNSMRSLGPAVVATLMKGENKYWANHWVYWAGPMGGALLAAILYWIFDSVDSKAFASPVYAEPSVNWAYNNGMPNRPQVKMPATNMDEELNGYQLRNRKELLNTPDGDPGVYTVNGTSGRPSENGMVSAYSRPAYGTQIDYFDMFN